MTSYMLYNDIKLFSMGTVFQRSGKIKKMSKYVTFVILDGCFQPNVPNFFIS